MYTATVQLTINSFVPMSGVYGQSPSIDATIGAPKDVSPEPSEDVFSGDGQSITITVPKGYDGSVQIIYQLADPNYVLLGAAFKNPNGGVGREEFRQVDLYRDPNSSSMMVTDSCMQKCDKVMFSYVILVQEAKTGNIGLIDPDIETNEAES